MGVYLTRRQREANVESRWRAIIDMIDQVLTQARAEGGRDPALLPLKKLQDAAALRDEAMLVRAGERYLRLTRVVPPGCYALRTGAEPSLLLDGACLPPGQRPEDWDLLVWHPQVYR